MSLRLIFLAILFFAHLACSSADQRAVAVAGSDLGPSRAASSVAPGSRPRIVVLGDSLTAGLGLPLEEAYPSLLQQRLDQGGYPYEIVNAGVSGDTTAAGLNRLEWTLDGDVRILILALGANDGLRGMPIDRMKANLAAIIERAQQRGIDVLLAGMEVPSNLGRAYSSEFRQVFPDLARQHGIPLMPFLLDGVAGITALNQGDRIHPNREGARVVADNVWQALEPIVRRDAATR